MPSTCIQVFSGNVEQPKQLNIMTSVTSEQLLETSPSTSARYAELQQRRYPRDVAPAHIGCALCFKLVDEADKVPGKCSSQVSKKEEKKKKEKEEKEKHKEKEKKKNPSLQLITKGSVSYLLIAKAYCREGHASVTDFGVFSRGYDLGGGGQRLGSPLDRLFWVCVCVCMLAIELIRLIVCKCSSCVMLMLSVDCYDCRCRSSFFSSSSSASSP